MLSGIVEIDVHGMQTEDAVRVIVEKVGCVPGSVYRIRIIHGYHGGTRIRSAIREEFGYGRSLKVRRIEMGQNPGITELVLREF